MRIQLRLINMRILGAETKGGVVLIKLKKLENNDNKIELDITYKDRNSSQEKSNTEFVLNTNKKNYYQNNGIRKAILLTRYVNLLKDWIITERRNLSKQVITVFPLKRLILEDGIFIPPIDSQLGVWERQSSPIKINNDDKELFQQFTSYFQTEKTAISDQDLDRELEILNKLMEK